MNSQTPARQLLVEAACVLLMCASITRLLALDIGELQLRRQTRARQEMMPAVGSLDGIDAKGLPATAVATGGGYSLLFAVHASRIAEDVTFWNDVMRLADVGAAPIEYIGICDAGSACNEAQPTAMFRILGYLDPFEMRILSRGDAHNEALLYHGSSLASRAKLVAEPRAMADAVGKGLR
jgi:hypothetical protein